MAHGYILATLVASALYPVHGLNFTVGTCIVQYFEMCASDLIKFYMLTSVHELDSGKPFVINNNKPELPKEIRMENSFKIIIHGYAGGNDFPQIKNISREYLMTNKTNVMMIDWHRLTSIPCYPTAVVNTKQAGECIASLLLALRDNHPSFDPLNTHIIGFSLGAHAAGFAGNALERLTNEKVSRITGLDPALPLFAVSNSSWKLDSSDAKFVDVIHTNAGIYGKIEPCGHVDFYLNGGQTQPNCHHMKNKPLCSHMLATTFFAESISSDVGFWGVRCSSYFQYLFGFCGKQSLIFNSDQLLMGEHCLNDSYGIVFVYTNSRPPYARGRKTLR